MIEFLRSRVELTLILVTMAGMFAAGLWWTAKLDGRVTVLEDWKLEAKPIVAKMDVMELRIERQFELLKKIDDRLCELQKSVFMMTGQQGAKP